MTYVHVTSAANTFYGTTMKALATNIGGSDTIGWNTGMTYTNIPAFLDGALNYIYATNLPSGDLLCALYRPDYTPSNVWPQAYSLFTSKKFTYNFYYWLYAGTGCNSGKMRFYGCDDNGKTCNDYIKDFDDPLNGFTTVTPRAFWQEQINFSYQNSQEIVYRAGNTQVIRI
jgi:hypothetical protein